MTREEVFEMVKNTGFPAAYHHFEEGQSPDPPFVVYQYPESSYLYADGRVYAKIEKLDIELYTDRKDLLAEKKIETLLDKRGIVYDKTESYLDTEKMYEVLYEMEVVIDGEQD